MDYGMQVTAASAERIWQSLSVLAANLSGQSVPGYRGDSVFSRQLEQMQTGRKPGFALQAASNFTTGLVKTTGRQLDVAIDGQGWLVVQAADGSEGLTRNGLLSLTPDGDLLAGTGQVVLGEGGPLVVPEFSQLTIGDDGTISIIPRGGNEVEEVDRLRLVNPPADNLVRGPDGLFRLADGGTPVADEQVQLVSGALEESNVELMGEYLNMVDAGKTLELHVRMMKAFDQMADRGNELLRPLSPGRGW